MKANENKTHSNALNFSSIPITPNDLMRKAIQRAFQLNHAIIGEVENEC